MSTTSQRDLRDSTALRSTRSVTADYHKEFQGHAEFHLREVVANMRDRIKEAEEMNTALRDKSEEYARVLSGVTAERDRLLAELAKEKAKSKARAVAKKTPTQIKQPKQQTDIAPGPAPHDSKLSLVVRTLPGGQKIIGSQG